MIASIAEKIRERVHSIEITPSIPAIFLPLLELLNAPPEAVKLDEVVKLVSYDNTIAVQCLRVAGSPLFGPSAVTSNHQRSGNQPGAAPSSNHSPYLLLGPSLPRQKVGPRPNHILETFSGLRHGLPEIQRKADQCRQGQGVHGGLLHDIGFLVNCLVFSSEFATAVECACNEQIPLDEAERKTMGFTHYETGRVLAEKWHLGDDIIQVIAHHHAIEESETAQSLVAVVHLSDLLCRMRGLGYGYYERQKVDLIHDPAWGVLSKHHRELDGVDLARLTFELDEAVAEIYELVSTIFGSAAAQN